MSNASTPRRYSHEAGGCRLVRRRSVRFIARLSRCPDLDTLVGATVDGLAELLGYTHSVLMLLDEEGGRLFTIASHGYDTQGVGSEVPVGEGTAGMAAARSAPIRIGNLLQMRKYSSTVRRSFEEEGVRPGREIPCRTCATPRAGWRCRASRSGDLVGVLMVESGRAVAFDEEDELLLGVVSSFVATAIEIDRAREKEAPLAPPLSSAAPAGPVGSATAVRYFSVDGSTFLDGDYLIRGVAGRILWSLLEQHAASGRVDFTNKEIRLDPRLEPPGFRDNLDTRLILLKRVDGPRRADPSGEDRPWPLPSLGGRRCAPRRGLTLARPARHLRAHLQPRAAVRRLLSCRTSLMGVAGHPSQSRAVVAVMCHGWKGSSCECSPSDRRGVFGRVERDRVLPSARGEYLVLL